MISPLRRVVAIACATTVGGTGLALVPRSVDAVAHPPSSEVAAAKTTIRPGELAKGRKPQVLHLRKRTIHDGKRTVKVRLKPRNVKLLGKSRRGYVVNRINPDHVLFVRSGHKPRRVTGFSMYGGHVNDGGTRVAEVEDDRTESWLNAVAVPSGKKLCLGCTIPEYSWFVAFPGKRMVLSNGAATYWYAPAERRRTNIVKAPAEVADPRHNRLVIRGGRDEDEFQLVAFRNPNRTLGSWDRGQPLRISPDGKYLLTTIGDDKIRVRSTKDGQVVRTFKAAGRIDRSARFETDRTVLMSVEGHKVAANVRCTLGGKCERTTRTEKKLGRLNLDWPTQNGV